MCRDHLHDRCGSNTRYKTGVSWQVCGGKQCSAEDQAIDSKELCGSGQVGSAKGKNPVDNARENDQDHDPESGQVNVRESHDSRHGEIVRRCRAASTWYLGPY
jgi:hypothetical protein